MIGENKDMRVKLLAHTKSTDGYPPEEWEGLWAISMGGSLYKLDNIPFYAKGMSCDDVVEARLEDNEYRIVRVVTQSANSTIRIVVFDLSKENLVREELAILGCEMEGSGIPGLIALNVPRSSKESVTEYLERAFAAGILDYEEGAIR